MSIIWLALLSLAVFVPVSYADVSYHTSGFHALDGPTSIDTITIQNHTYAIVSSSVDGAVQILNITNPYLPQPVYSISGQYLVDAQDVVAVNVGDKAYVMIAGAKTGSIQIMDITNPQAPLIIGDIAGFETLDDTGELHHIDGSRAVDDTSGFEALGGVNNLKLLSLPGNYTYVVASGHADDAVQIMDVTFYDYPGHTFDYNCMYAPRPVASIFDGEYDTILDGVWSTLPIKKWDREYIFAVGSGNYISVLDVSHITTPYTDLRPCDDPRRSEAYRDGSTADSSSVPQYTGSSSLFGPRPIVGVTNSTAGFESLNSINKMVAITHTDDNTIPTRVYEDIVQRTEGADDATPLKRGPTHIIAISDGSVQVIRINSTHAHYLNSTHDTIRLPPKTDMPDITLAPVHTIYDDTDGFEALGGARDIKLAHVDNHTIGVIAGFDDDALQIIDFTIPEDPKPISSIFDGMNGFEALGGVYGVEITDIGDNTYVIAASHLDDGVQIIDITNPYKPLPVSGVFDHSYFDSLGGANHVTISEISDRLYAIVTASSDNSLQIIDFASPEYPVSAASIRDDTDGFEALGGAQDFVLSTIKNRIYGAVVGHSDNAVQIIDITIPNNPKPISAMFDDTDGFEALGGASGIDAVTIHEHTYLVVASKSDNAVQIVNMTNPAHPRPVYAVFDDTDGFEALGGASRVQCHITYCLVTANTDDAVQILNITQDGSPQPLAAIFDGRDGFKSLKNAGEIQITTINSQTLAVVTARGDGGLQIIDITNPASPKAVSNLFYYTEGFDSLSSIRNVGIYNDTYAITANGLGGTVSIIDMTYPDSPKVISSINYHMHGLGDLYGVTGIDTYNNTHAVFSSKDKSSVLIFDIAEPSSPRLVSVINDQK